MDNTEKRICPICKNTFSPKTCKHIFCSRACYLKYFYGEHPTKFPIYICQYCGTKSQLDFSPITNLRKWSSFICPGCGHDACDRQEYSVVHKIRIELHYEKGEV